MYALLKFLAGSVLRIFFRRIDVGGLENVPKNSRVIVSCNHPNAYVEAMLVGILLTDLKFSILVRADVFQNKILGFILDKFFLIPVYRPRDGMQNMHKNKKSFERAVEKIAQGRSILIFSEGTSQRGKEILPLKTGTVRLGFQTFETLKEEVYILPVSVNYTYFTKQQEAVHIRVNKPLKVSEYYTDDQETYFNQVKQMSGHLEERLRTGIVQMNYDQIKPFNQQFRVSRNHFLKQDKAFVNYSNIAFNTEQSGDPLITKNSKSIFRYLELPFVFLGGCVHYSIIWLFEYITSKVPLSKEFYTSVWLSLMMLFIFFTPLFLLLFFSAKNILLVFVLGYMSLLSFYRNLGYKTSLSFFKDKI